MKKLLVLLSLTAFVVACSEDPPAPTDTAGDISTDGIDVGPDDVTDDTEIGPDVPDEGPTISFYFAGAQGDKGQGLDEVTLTNADDQDLASPGVQINLKVQTHKVETGRIVSVYVDGAAAAAGPITAVEDAGEATIAVTLNASPGLVVRVEVTNQAGEEASDEKNIIVLTEACTVALAPPAQDGCLSGDADPDTAGVQIALTVSTDDPVACPSASLDTTIDGSVQNYGPADMDGDGQVTFYVTVAAGGESLETAVDVSATVHHVSESAKDAVVQSAYNFDNIQPEVTITSPDINLIPTLTAAHDEDPVAAGIQFTVTGTATGVSAPPAEPVTISLNGEVEGTASVDGDSFSFQLSIIDTGSVTIVATAVDDCAHEAQAEVSLDAFPVEPSLMILQPTDGAVLLAKDDGDSGTSAYELDIAVQLQSPNAGDTLKIQCRSEAGSEQIFFDIAQAAVAKPFPEENTWNIATVLDPGTLTNEVVCRAMLDGPNPAASPNIDLTLALPGPTIALGAPVSGSLLSNKSAVTVSGTATGLEGVALNVRLIGAGGFVAVELLSDPVTAGLFGQDIDFESVSPFPDGKYTIEVDGTDGYGNVASDLGASGKSVVTFDTVAPLLVAIQPAGVFISGAEDEDPVTPGFQTTIIMAMNNEVISAGAQICLQVGGEDLGCQNVAAATFDASWSGVTLQPGPNNPLLATGNDAAGNAAAPYNVTLNLDVDAPVVTITDPASNIVTVNDAIDVTANVNDNQTGAPITNASPQLLLNGSDSGLVSANNGDGTYTFSGVSLVAGENQLQVLVDIGAQGASPIRLVTYKTSQPTIALSAPTNGQVFNLASPECAGIALDCTMSVSATTTEAEDGSTASLAVDCGGGVNNYGGSITGGGVTFDTVVLSHGGTCTLTPSVTDLAQQTVQGAAVAVTVDRLAPVVSRFDEPFDDFLQPDDDQDPGTPGIQYKLQVVVQGVEAGQTLSVDVHLQGQAPGSLYQTNLPVDAPDGVDTEVNFPVIDYPDGSLELSATVADQAGNTASLDKLIFVQSVKPAVQIKSPANPSGDCGSCGNKGVCNAGTCWFTWNLSHDEKIHVTLGGFLDGINNFRICSDSPGLAGGTPCAQEGSFQVHLGTAQEGLQTIDLGGLLPDGFQTLSAELMPTDNGEWVSSLDELAEADRSRRINVDTIAPSVSGLGSSSDVEAPNGVLNIAEQVGGQPAGTYSLEFSSDEAGSADIFVNGQLQSEIPATVGVNATTIVLGPGGVEIYVRVTDNNGNMSVGLPGAEAYTPTVDLTAPGLEFNSPKDLVWIGGAAPGDVVLSVTLEPQEAEADVSVTLSDGGIEVGTTSVTVGTATFAGALTEGSHTFTATVSDPAGNIGAAATTPATVNVDLTAPVASITSPSDEEFVTDDADGQGGFQVSVGFDAGDAMAQASWALSASDCPDNTFTNCGNPAPVNSGSVDIVTSLSELATVTIAGAESYVILSLEVTDEAGNKSTSSVKVTVIVADCVVSFVDLPNAWINKSHCAPATDCDVTVKVLPSATCGGHTLTLNDGGDQVGQQAGTGGQEANFLLTVSDGQSISLQAIATIGGSEIGSSAIATPQVDTTAPTATLISTVIDGFLTPDGAGIHKYNKSHDNNAASSDVLEVHALVRVVDANALNGGVVSVVRTEVSDPGNTATLAPNVTSLANGSDLDVTLKEIALPDQEVTQIDVTIQDEAGNTAVVSFTGDADMLKPSSPFVSIVGTVDARLPAVTLQWNANGDNGGSGDPASSYEVHYSRSSINSANFDSACDVSSLINSDPVPTPATPPATENYVVSGPDPRPDGDPCKFSADESNGIWYFAVRISDDVGNQSLLVGISTASTDKVTPSSTTITFSDAFRDAVLGGDGSKRDSLTSVGATIGDVDGDSNGDIVVGHVNANTMCVIYGSDSMPASWSIDAKSSAGALRHNCVQPADLNAPQLSGATGLGGTSAALGDVNGDGRPDFATSARVGGQGVLLVYLGRADGAMIDLPNPDVIIETGLGGFPPAFASFCGAGRFMGGNVDAIGVGEIAFGNAFKVVAGDPAWSVGGGTVLDLAAPGGHDILTITSAETVVGWGAFCNGVGDVMATPGGGGAAGDIVVQRIAGDADSPLYLIPGRAVSGSETTQITLADPPVPTGEDANILRLRQEAGNLKADFGTGGFFGSDVTGDGTPDVVVAHYNRQVAKGGDGKSLMIFDGATLGQINPGTYLRVTAQSAEGNAWYGTNGTIVNVSLTSSISAAAVGNWDGWQYAGSSTVDLFHLGEAGEGMLRANHATDDGQYQLGLFPADDMRVSSDGIGPTGVWVSGGNDIDGSLGPEIVSGTDQGTVVIIR